MIPLSRQETVKNLTVGWHYFPPGCSYLPSHRASPLVGHITLLGDVSTTCPESFSENGMTVKSNSCKSITLWLGISFKVKFRQRSCGWTKVTKNRSGFAFVDQFICGLCVCACECAICSDQLSNDCHMSLSEHSNFQSVSADCFEISTRVTA